jgi:hypothetical protein
LGAARKQQERRAQRKLAGLVVAGVALIIVAVIVDLGIDDVNHVVKAVGEALIVTGLIGAIVERPLRRVFADEVARDTFMTLFGINAPKEYLEGLESVLRTDRLSWDHSWYITLDWHDQPTLLRVRLQATNDSTNIGSSEMKLGGIWLMPSSDGAPACRFERLEIAVRDRDGQTRKHEQLEAKELAQIVAAKATGLAAEADDVYGEMRIEPGGQLTTTLVGEVYLRLPILVPMTQRYPSLKSGFTIAGSALDALDVRVRSGVDTLDVRTEKDRAGETRYVFETNGLTLPGHTFRLEIVPKGSPQAATPSPGQAGPGAPAATPSPQQAGPGAPAEGGPGDRGA